MLTSEEPRRGERRGAVGIVVVGVGRHGPPVLACTGQSVSNLLAKRPPTVRGGARRAGKKDARRAGGGALRASGIVEALTAAARQDLECAREPPDAVAGIGRLGKEPGSTAPREPGAPTA